MKQHCIALLVALSVLSLPAAAQVLVETESFTDKGGWVSDHQAFEQIGSAYLLAHGLGTPVEDASTTVTFDRPGKYHVYVSTYNWTSPWYEGEGPGALRRIPQADLDELQAIFDETGGTERMEAVERASREKAAELGMDFDEYTKYTYEHCSPGHFNNEE